MVKEERIVELETENAALHLRLAEQCRERMGKSRREACRAETPRVCACSGSAASQLCRQLQTLKRELREFQASTTGLLGDFQAQCGAGVAAAVAAAQAAQLQGQTLQACQAQAVGLQQSLREVSARHELEKQRRKHLHNRLVELKGNVRVHCRIRPLLPLDGELEGPGPQNGSGSGEVAHAMDDETVLVRCHRPSHPPINKTYRFERVYGPAESQREVFEDVRPLLTSLLDGYNVCIMAYGQTGSGKSYTMLGRHAEAEPAHGDDRGLVPRAARELFRLLSEDPSRSPRLHVSMVQVYNNDVFDLLAKDGSAGLAGAKREVTTTKEGRTEVSALARRAVGSAGELMRLVHGGLRLRAQHPTLVHAASSRSHLIITVSLAAAGSSDSPGQLQVGPLQQPPNATPPALVPGDRAGHLQLEQVQPRLQLVDLAGSECIGESGVTGLALREASFINRSLAALADVLGALSQRRAHVPYRNSSLTHLLQDSIGTVFPPSTPTHSRPCPGTAPQRHQPGRAPPTPRTAAPAWAQPRSTTNPGEHPPPTQPPLPGHSPTAPPTRESTPHPRNHPCLGTAPRHHQPGRAPPTHATTPAWAQPRSATNPGEHPPPTQPPLPGHSPAAPPTRESTPHPCNHPCLGTAPRRHQPGRAPPTHATTPAWAQPHGTTNPGEHPPPTQPPLPGHSPAAPPTRESTPHPRNHPCLGTAPQRHQPRRAPPTHATTPAWAQPRSATNPGEHPPPTQPPLPGHSPLAPPTQESTPHPRNHPCLGTAPQRHQPRRAPPPTQPPLPGHSPLAPPTQESTPHPRNHPCPDTAPQRHQPGRAPPPGAAPAWAQPHGTTNPGEPPPPPRCTSLSCSCTRAATHEGRGRGALCALRRWAALQPQVGSGPVPAGKVGRTEGHPTGGRSVLRA
nr:kinesin-like protein KIF25 isoform X5 [Oryctolagus cuniculus]